MDIGCGFGDLTIRLNRKPDIQRIYGIDISKDMVEYAEQHYSAQNIRYLIEDMNIEWNQLNSEIRELEGKVDVIFSNFVFHWMYTNHENLLKNIYRLLTRKGKVYINAMQLPNPLESTKGLSSYFLSKFPAIPSESEQIDQWCRSLEMTKLQVLTLRRDGFSSLQEPNDFDKGLLSLQICDSLSTIVICARYCFNDGQPILSVLWLLLFVKNIEILD